MKRNVAPFFPSFFSLYSIILWIGINILIVKDQKSLRLSTALGKVKYFLQYSKGYLTANIKDQRSLIKEKVY